MPIRRRTLLASLAAPAIIRAARAQSSRQVSILTWNIPNAQPLMDTWIKDFTATRPGVSVQWLDKKGPDLPAFYQTQLVAGTPPDVIDLQGGLGIEYAAQGALADLTPHLAQHADVRSRFNADYLANWVFDGKNYMLPFYISKTLAVLQQDAVPEGRTRRARPTASTLCSIRLQKSAPATRADS